MKRIIDKSKVLSNQMRARAMAVEGADFLLRRVAEDLVDRLAVQNRTFDRAVYVGPPSAHVEDMIAATGKVRELTHVDPLDFHDDEHLSLEQGTHDLIISLVHLHETNDVPGLLLQMRMAMKPDGLLIACVPGSGSLQELRSVLMHVEEATLGGASPRVLPFMDVRAAGGLLQRAGFALPVVDHDEVIVRYASMFDLVKDLRAMGATNSLVERSRRVLTWPFFLRAAEAYGQDHADADGRIRATFGFVWMSGWVPDASQPKPLKPGSAKASLATVLKDRS